MVTLTWTDEADQRIAIRTYENQPDTFTVTVSGLGATVTETASNTHGQEGQIMLTLELSIETIQTAVDQGNESYGISIEIVMVDAGMQAPPIGVIGFTDPGNNYEYAAEITYLVPE